MVKLDHADEVQHPLTNNGKVLSYGKYDFHFEVKYFSLTYGKLHKIYSMKDIFVS